MGLLYMWLQRELIPPCDTRRREKVGALYSDKEKWDATIGEEIDFLSMNHLTQFPVVNIAVCSRRSKFLLCSSNTLRLLLIAGTNFSEFSGNQQNR